MTDNDALPMHYKMATGQKNFLPVVPVAPKTPA